MAREFTVQIDGQEHTARPLLLGAFRDLTRLDAFASVDALLSLEAWDKLGAEERVKHLENGSHIIAAYLRKPVQWVQDTVTKEEMVLILLEAALRSIPPKKEGQTDPPAVSP